jgi:hypothetical protein
MRFLEIDGKRYAWKDILQKRREQLSREPQPALFELKEDTRPPMERTAAGRYFEPTLFDRDPRWWALLPRTSCGASFCAGISGSCPTWRRAMSLT